MIRLSMVAIPLAAGAIVGVCALGATQAPARVLRVHVPRTLDTSSPGTSLVRSPELWATVNLCNTARHRNEIGVRGSMPSDGHPHDLMYMRFLVQSLDPTTHRWADLGKSAESGFVLVGTAALPRQDGHSFGFKPSTTSYTLRGLVEFQWRRAGHPVHAATRVTTAGHKDVAGAEPKGFSAATCALT